MNEEEEQSIIHLQRSRTFHSNLGFNPPENANKTEVIYLMLRISATMDTTSIIEQGIYIKYASYESNVECS